MNEQILKDDLLKLDAKSLRRRLRQVVGPQDREIILDGRKVLNFSSNDYLGLANDSRLRAAATAALETQGFGAGASRLICGNNIEHERLEHKIAALKNTEASLLYSSGYMANVGIIQALMGREDVIIADRYNHASIIDGIILSRAALKRYQHNDMQSLEETLKASRGFKRRLIVTDTVFSMDGDRAPLKEIVRLARHYGAWVMVDEAHAFGVLGFNGAGLVEEEGLSSEVDIQMGTLSKAAGTFGAYAAGTRTLRDYLLNHSRSFIYTTAMPAAVAAAASAAVDIIKEDKQRREGLLRMADVLRRSLKGMGFDTMSSTTPIIPILFKEEQKALDASKHLLEGGIFVSAIRPPTVPANTARLRLTVTAAHTKEDITRLLEAMRGL